DGDTIVSFSKVGPDDLLSNLSVTIKNTELLTEDLLKITHAIHSGNGTLATILNDTIMSADLKHSIKTIKGISTEASHTIQDLNQLVTSLKTDDSSVLGLLLNDTISATQLKKTITHLETSGMEMELAIQKVHTIVDDINSSEGGFNYILKDTALVNSLKSTLKNVNEGTDKFNQNMEALKHNFLTKGYFRKLDRQEKAKDN